MNSYLSKIFGNNLNLIVCRSKWSILLTSFNPETTRNTKLYRYLVWSYFNVNVKGSLPQYPKIRGFFCWKFSESFEDSTQGRVLFKMKSSWSFSGNFVKFVRVFSMLTHFMLLGAGTSGMKWINIHCWTSFCDWVVNTLMDVAILCD